MIIITHLISILEHILNISRILEIFLYIFKFKDIIV